MTDTNYTMEGADRLHTSFTDEEVAYGLPALIYSGLRKLDNENSHFQIDSPL